MALPIPANTTCDIYHAGNAPPNPPDVAHVGCYLEEDYSNIKPLQTGLNYAHILRVPATTDLRDNYGGGPAGGVGSGTSKTGAALTGILGARPGRGPAAEH